VHEGHTNQPAIRITYILIFRCSICQPRLEYIGVVDSGRCRRAVTTAVGPTFSSSARRNWGHFKTEAFGEELLRAELHWTRKRTAKGEILIISLLRCTYQARILASTWPTGLDDADNAGRRRCFNAVPASSIPCNVYTTHRCFSPLSEHSPFFFKQRPRQSLALFILCLRIGTPYNDLHVTCGAARPRCLAYSHYTATPSRMVYPARFPQKKP
jgi:hypothetical protein